MEPPTQSAWVWVNSGSSWGTGRPGVLQSMGLQKAGTRLSDWTELNWPSCVTCLKSRSIRVCTLFTCRMGVFEVQLIYHRGSFNNKILFHCCLLQITEYSSLCYRKVLIFNLHYIQKCVAVNAQSTWCFQADNSLRLSYVTHVLLHGWDEEFSGRKRSCSVLVAHALLGLPAQPGRLLSPEQTL